MQQNLIDIKSESDYYILQEFRFVMVYQDHLIKFVLLKLLKTKRVEEVAFTLLENTTFGAPLN